MKIWRVTGIFAALLLGHLGLVVGGDAVSQDQTATVRSSNYNQVEPETHS
jgi:hypothetical protein